MDNSKRIPQLNLTEINTKACLPLFKEFLWSALQILLFLMLAAIIIDVSVKHKYTIVSKHSVQSSL